MKIYAPSANERHLQWHSENYFGLVNSIMLHKMLPCREHLQVHLLIFPAEPVSVSQQCSAGLELRSDS